MDYFVSANYEPFHQWQIELLIESFKRNNRQDNLVVSLTKMDEEVIHPDFSINILSHKRLIAHDNIGKIRGYNKLNDLYSLMWAIKDGHLKQPFMTMPVDSVLYSPPPDAPDYPILSYQVDPFFAPELIQKNIGDVADILPASITDTTNPTKPESWPSIGDLFVCNKFPIEFFEQWIELTESLAFKQLRKNGKIWEFTDRLALNLLVHKLIGTVPLRGIYDYESDMLSNFPKHIIHYDKGLLPIFHKDMFPYAPPNYFSFGNPFAVLGGNSPTAAFNYMSELARSYTRTNKRLQQVRN